MAQPDLSIHHPHAGITAIGWAGAIIAALAAQQHGTWTFDANTQRAIAEGDDMPRHWAGITEAATGAEVSINLSHAGDQRIYLAAIYPNGYEPWIDGRGRVTREAITVSRSKPPALVADELYKRLLTRTGYFTTLEKARAQKAASEAAHATAAATAAELRAVMGAETPHAWNCEPTKDNEREIASPPWMRVHVAGRVSTGGYGIDLKLDNLQPEEARAILAIAHAGGARKED